MGIAQFLAAMGGQIDHRQTRPRPHHTRRFRQRQFGGLCVMEDLMEQHRIKGGIGKGQRGKVALHQRDMLGGQMLQPRAGNPQHFGAFVERRHMRGAWAQPFGHAARAGADIEQCAKRPLERARQRRLDRRIGADQPGHLVPALRVGGEIGGRRRLARLPDRGERGAVSLTDAREIGVIGFGGGEQPRGGLPHRRGLAMIDRAFQEHPAALLAPCGQPRIAQNLDMARDARLTLAQNLRQFAHSQLHRGEQAQDAGACGIG